MSLYSGTGFNGGSSGNESSNKNEGRPLATFFRIAFTYLAAASMLSWVLYAARMIRIFGKLHQIIFLEFLGVNLALTLVFVCILWGARKGRSVKLILVALSFELVGAIVFVIDDMFLRSDGVLHGGLWKSIT